MPESNAAAKRRQQKANRAAGLGDEQGRMPARVKDAPTLLKCTVCQQEMKVTKTNTELTAHSTGKHGKTLEECFPGAEKIGAELAAAKAKPGANGKSGSGGSNLTKAQKKKQAEAGLDDLLSAGLSGKKGSKKK